MRIKIFKLAIICDIDFLLQQAYSQVGYSYY